MEQQIKKPKAKVIGKDGNVFSVIATCQQALRNAGRDDDAKKMYERIQAEAQSYGQALNIMQEYVDMV